MRALHVVSTVLCGFAATIGTGFAADANDVVPPEVTVLSPLPGAMLSGDPHVTVKGVAKDEGSGVKSVRVNGIAVEFGSAGEFSVPRSLVHGTNLFSVEVEDRAGHSGYTSWATFYSASYLPPETSVPAGIASFLPRRLVPEVRDVFVAALGLDADGFAEALVGRDIGGGTVADVLLAPPEVELNPSDGAYRVKVRFPSLSLVVHDANGSRKVSASDVDFWMRVRPPAAASRGEYAEVTDVEVRVPGALRERDRALEADLEHAWEERLPAVVGAALKEAFGDRCEGPRPSGLTTCFERATLDIDPRGVLIVADANTTAQSPRDPALPGSLFREVGDPPSHEGLFAASLSEDFINRVLYTSWAAGFSRVEIDAEFLRPFASIDPKARLLLEVDLRLPAAAQVGGRKHPLTLTLGEVHLALRAYAPDPVEPALLLSFVVHLEAAPDVTLARDVSAVLFSPAAWRTLDSSVEANPLGLDSEFVKATLDRLLPRALPYLAGIIEEIPIPSYEGYGMAVKSLRPTGDGEGGYLTLAGDPIRDSDEDEDDAEDE